MRTSAPGWQAFLELGFRPLYLAGSVWAVVSVALWLYAPRWLIGPMDGVAWHAHEMLWGFIGTIAVGFLLTAASNWTGVNPLRGWPLAVLCGLWGTARIGFLFPHATAFQIAACVELTFFVGAAFALARAIYGTGNRRNYGIPLMLLALGGADAAYLAAVRQGDYVHLMAHFHTGLLCMAVIALLIARRVIPFFAMRAVSGLTIAMHTRSGQWQVAAAVLAVFSVLMHWPWATAAALGVAGALAFVQLAAWHPWSVRRLPLLWILYAGYGGLGTGLLLAAAHAAGAVIRIAWPAHMIGMGGFGVLIIGMVTRTALGHLGRPLKTDRCMVTTFALVIAATGLRLCALTTVPFAAAALHAAALAWIGAFSLYVWRFFPILIRSRLS